MVSRYIKINNCNDCEYNGHIDKKNICSNPIHENIDTSRVEFENKYYPITSKIFITSPIPDWCTLPKDVK